MLLRRYHNVENNVADEGVVTAPESSIVKEDKPVEPIVEVAPKYINKRVEKKKAKR